jgi:PTS system galactitol-specific IIC component
MAGVMFLMPRMVKILMEGLIPVSEAAKSFMQKRFAGKEFYIGLDSAVAIGHPAAIATALILVPITIFLALIIPGNRVLPFGDLATIPFMVAMVAPIARGNVFRSVIIGAIVIAVGLLIATNVSPLHTQAAIDAAFKFPEGASNISSICDGANPLTWILLKIMQIFG